MPKTLITDAALRAAAEAGDLPVDIHLRKSFVAEIKADGSNSRVLDFTISTDAVDRYGDTVAVEGWQLDAFKKNPVVLWAHDSSMLPVAKASDVRIEKGKLKAKAEFMPRDISGFADAVFNALKLGYLSATSVGFIPTKYAFADDAGRRFGIDFLEQELVEFSIVPVPANAEALIEGRSLPFDAAPLRDWAAKLLGTAPGTPDEPDPAAGAALAAAAMRWRRARALRHLAV